MIKIYNNNNDNYNQDIVAVSDAMLEMWISFASVGDPTPPTSSLQTTWEPVTPEDHRYLVIGEQ